MTVLYGGHTGMVHVESSANSISINVPSGVSNGDLMIAVVISDADQAATCSGWTLLTSQISSSSRLIALYKEADGESGSYTFQGTSSTQWTGDIIYLEKSEGDWNIEDFDSAAVGAGSYDALPVTATEDSSLCLVLLGSDDSGAITQFPSGYSIADEYDSSDPVLGIYYEEIDTGEESPGTVTASGDISFITIAIQNTEGSGASILPIIMNEMNQFNGGLI